MMKAGKMTVFYVKQGDSKAPSTSSNIERLEVDGKVYLKPETQVATGDRGTFDMKTEVLTLRAKRWCCPKARMC
jgi:lipopolysaccharide export system protein LptA